MTDSIDAFLKDAAIRKPANLVALPIRDFIAKWGAQRRGILQVGTITADLQRFGLVTEPPFEDGWIDNTVRLISTKALKERESAGAGSGDADELPGRASALRISGLRSASAGIVSVSREASVGDAKTAMMRFDFSQVAVMGGVRSLYGAVGWKSIGIKEMLKPNASLADCLVLSEPVGLGDDLLRHVPRIVEEGYVFVKSKDGKICGIVTTADLSAEFAVLAGPFLLIGEVERELRRLVNGGFSPEQIQGAVGPGGSDRKASNADNLSFGECVRLFESKDNWAALNWPFGQNQFILALSETRMLRNEIMHFSPDPIEVERLVKVRNVLNWLRMI